MRENIRKKMKSKEGFTLAELLIVVAIIAILAMISIPIFTSRLNDAKKNTDKANERSAKAAAVSEYLSKNESGEVSYYFDAENGTVVKSVDKPSGNNAIKAYGNKYTDDDNSTKNHEAQIIKVTITDKDADGGGSVTVTWE